MKDRLLTATEFAKKLGVTRQNVYYWIKNGMPVVGRSENKYRRHKYLIDPVIAEEWVTTYIGQGS